MEHIKKGMLVKIVTLDINICPTWRADDKYAGNNCELCLEHFPQEYKCCRDDRAPLKKVGQVLPDLYVYIGGNKKTKVVELLGPKGLIKISLELHENGIIEKRFKLVPCANA